MITIVNPFRLIITISCLIAYCASGHYGEAAALALGTTIWSMGVNK